MEMYKRKYSILSNDELLQKLNEIRHDDAIKQRKVKHEACLALFDERGYKVCEDNKIRQK